MTAADWDAGGAHALGMVIDGEMPLLVNASPGPVTFRLPALDAAPEERRSAAWTVRVDTTRDEPPRLEEGVIELAPHARALLRRGRERRLTALGGGR